MKMDSGVLKRAELIAYYIQTNEGIHLSDKSHHDIKCNVQGAVEHLKHRVDQYKKENHALRWNELRLYLKREKPEGFQEILDVMSRLDKRESIR